MDADVATTQQADELAADIMRPRQRPLVLVSTASDGTFRFDVPRLRSELDGIADVVTIATGTATKHLEHLLPPKAQVFNGAGRSYPPDFNGDADWHRSHLRFPEHSDTRDLVDDAMAQTGRRTVESARTPSIRRATGIVQRFFDDDTRAIVRLGDGTMVSATAALLPPDLPLAAALVVGEPVSGILDDLELRPEPVAADLSALSAGSHTLALVVKVTELRATVQLHPREAFVLRRRDVAGDDVPVGDVLHVGDVIRVRVRRDPGLALSHADADPAAPLTPAPALVVGGAPWLAEGRARSAPNQTMSDAAAPATPVTEPQDAPPAPTASAAPRDADHATRHDVNALAREVSALRGDMLALTNLVARGGRSATDDGTLARLRAENEQLRAKLAEERAERANAEAKLAEATQEGREKGRALRDARRAAERSHVDATADGIRLEIERTWGNRTAPGERTRWPLREYRFGTGFIESLDALDENQLSKAVRACVDAITGRDREIPARELHRLRTGEGGDDPYVIRDADGARCWRSSIEQNAPGARRLHYWELPGGVIELSRIVHHDDTRP
ncbi:hypothetical protein [Microbacterium sp. H1-D42]|uniref:hypothetical protein n=1 Tax=Microbacterium sp. H1-D42 TaxID=2925844 RepID=UPI001F531551|nr:hypothetical protein [Microbacterium sp. H1-D42]UNK70684.1 hypothetical protein MNR00_16250 [Microbacterium sp. H1-D42]